MKSIKIVHYLAVLIISLPPPACVTTRFPIPTPFEAHSLSTTDLRYTNRTAAVTVAAAVAVAVAARRVKVAPPRRK